MKLRLLTTDDYDAVYALWLSCRGMGLNKEDDSPEGFAAFLRRNPDTCFCAEEDGVLIGAILAGNDGRRGYIYHTAVRDDFRGRGIGRTLVEAAMEALRACGIHKVALVVFAHNNIGNGFWEKMGFTAREDLVYRNRTLVAMTRIDT